MLHNRLPKVILSAAAVLLALMLLTVALHAAVFQKTIFGSDFFTIWMAARAAVQGADPYSEQLAQETQLGVYRRLIQPGETLDRLKFSYPAHALVPVIPPALMELDWALAYWLSFNLLLVLILPWLALSGRRRFPVMLLLFTPAFAFGLIMGNPAVSVGVCLLAAWGWLAREDGSPSPALQITAGALLAWVTIKPQMVSVVFLFLLLIMLRRRQKWAFLGFGGGVILLLAAAWILTPGWLTGWLARLADYASYRGALPLIFLLPQQILPFPWSQFAGYLLSLGGLFFTAWLFFRWWQGRTATLPILAWCSAFTFLIYPIQLDTYQQIILVIPILLWVMDARISNRQAHYIWWGALAVSWGIFLADLLKINPPLTYQLPFWAYLLFLAWVWVYYRRAFASSGANRY